jgi:glucose-6-phosphate isomerase
MRAGEAINRTEKRAVLHTALRAENPLPEIAAELTKMAAFVEAVHGGELKSATGKAFTDVVNIGIGGSDLGPRMVVSALKAYHSTKLRCHFVANVDPVDLQDTLANLNPETTLFIVASKTFTTQETLMNAEAAKAWLNMHDKAGAHFVAMTSNTPKAREFGIEESRIFAMWDFVGGRYSLWSSIGLRILIACAKARAPWTNIFLMPNSPAICRSYLRFWPFGITIFLMLKVMRYCPTASV